MEALFPTILALLIITLVSSQAALPSEEYWKKVFPNTPMPMAIKNIVSPDFMVYKRTHEGIQKDSAQYTAKYGGGHGDEGKLPVDSNITVFFFPSDLMLGTRMNLKFDKNAKDVVPFVPRYVANSISFSSKSLPEILKNLSITPKSTAAKILMRTIEMCEEPGIQGEEKTCATSLESMIDFSTSKLGKDVQAISQEIQQESPKQSYTIVPKVKKMGDDKSVVCHKLQYVYAVFKCHTLVGIDVYRVPLVGDNGSKVKSLVVCHKDTSAWNPNHLAFKILKVKPGTTSICHFLGRDAIVWVHN